METVTIRKIEYQVILRQTPEGQEAAGLVNTARHMREQGITEELYICRRKGERVYNVGLFNNGEYSTTIQIPGLCASDFRR